MCVFLSFCAAAFVLQKLNFRNMSTTIPPRQMMCRVCQRACPPEKFAGSELHGDRNARRCLDCDPGTAAAAANSPHKLPVAGGAGNSSAQRMSPRRTRDTSPTYGHGYGSAPEASAPRATSPGRPAPVAGGPGNSAGDLLRYYPKSQ